MLTENNQIVDRLMQVVSATSAIVQTKNGPVEDELTADKNALSAAKSLCGAHLQFLKNHNDDLGGCLKRGGDRERGRGGARNAYACLVVTVQYQNAILDRLIQIISKQTVMVPTKNGLVADEVAADKNSIAAAKFLISLQAKYMKYDAEDADIVMLNARDQKAIVERLMQILAKTSVIRQTKHGPFEDQAIADQNAIRAARVLISYEALEIGRPTARCLREGAGTAGSSASHDGFKIGEPIARCEPEIAGSSGLSASDASESRRAADGLRLNDRAQSCSSFEKEIPSPQPSPRNAGARGRSEIADDHLEESIARCEPDQTPAEPGYTAEDVVRETLRIVMRDRPDISDWIDKDALIERVRAKRYQARLACGEPVSVVLAVPRQVNRIAEPVRFSLTTDRKGM